MSTSNHRIGTVLVGAPLSSDLSTFVVCDIYNTLSVIVRRDVDVTIEMDVTLSSILAVL